VIDENFIPTELIQSTRMGTKATTKVEMLY
jgi:hypothetical protein